MGSALKISRGYKDPLGIRTEQAFILIITIIVRYVDPQTDEIDYSSEKFNPMRFLLDIHSNSLLDDLGKGLKYIQFIYFTYSAMKETVLDEETRLKKLVKDYFGDFVTARKTIEELESTLSDPSYFNERGGLLLEEVIDVYI